MLLVTSLLSKTGLLTNKMKAKAKETRKEGPNEHIAVTQNRSTSEYPEEINQAY
jgi:hypothetical protein